MSEVRDKIKKLIEDKKVSYKELAYDLHQDYFTVYYLINEAVKLDNSIAIEMENILNKKGYSSNDMGECIQLTKRSLQFNSLVAHTIDIFNTEVKKAIDDNKLDEHEKKQLVVALENFEINIVNEIEKIKDMLGIK